MRHYPNPKIFYCGYRHLQHRDRTQAVRPYWRFHWNPTPGAWFRNDEEVYYMGPDHIIAVPPGVPVQQGAVRAFEHVFMQIDGGPIINSCNRVLWVETAGELRCLLEEIKAHPSLKGFSRPEAEDLFLTLKVRAVASLVFSKILPDDIVVKQIDPRVEQAEELLENHLQSGISNDRLAEAVHMSTNGFIRLFSEQIGEPPQTRLMNMRLDRAAAMLTGSKESIESISMACGFYDRSYMSRLFKRRFEQSPAAFRKSSLHE